MLPIKHSEEIPMTLNLLHRRRILAAALAAPLTGAMQRAFAQSRGWPDRPI